MVLTDLESTVDVTTVTVIVDESIVEVDAPLGTIAPGSVLEHE
jgi:hypothetical protein